MTIPENTTDYHVRLLFSPTTATVITDDVMRLSVTRDLAGLFRQLGAGLASVEIENKDGRYAPRRVDSPYYTLLEPNNGLQIHANDPTNSGAWFVVGRDTLDGSAQLLPGYPLFVGNLDEISIRPGLSDPRNVDLRARDRLGSFTVRNMDTDVLTNVNVSSVVTVVLDEAGVPPEEREVQDIADTYDFVWFQDRQMMTVVREILQSGGYNAFVSADGRFHFMDRFFEFGQPVVGSYEAFTNLDLSVDLDNLVNKVRVEGEPRVIGDETVVAELAAPLVVPAGGHSNFFLEYFDPRNRERGAAIDLRQPIPGSDFIANASSDGSGADLTATMSVAVQFFAEAAVASLFNGAGQEAHVTHYTYVGKPILRMPAFQTEVEDTDSQARYGLRQQTWTSRLIGRPAFAQTWAEAILEVYAAPADRIGLSLRNVYPDVLSNELANVLHVTNSFAGIRGQFSIVGVNHRLETGPQGWVHEVSYDIEESRALEVLILDSAESGILDTNRLGRPEPQDLPEPVPPPTPIDAFAGTTAAPGAEIPARAGTTASPGVAIPTYAGTS